MGVDQNLSRRNFVKLFGLASGGLILGCNLSSGKTEIVRLDDGTSFNPNLFVQLKKDGNLVLVASRSEMGQGIRTSLASAIADEMEANWKYVSVEQATGDAIFGNQNTDGSRSVRTILEPMRKMGAMAKTILVKAAATRWQIPESSCKADNHYVINTITRDKVFYGDLVEEAMKLEAIDEATIVLKDKKDFKYIGKKLKSVDLKDFTHGTAVYGIDKRLPNMKFASVARCPSAFGTVKSFDKSDAAEIPGVENIIELERVERPFGMLGGVAVIASNTWAAFQGKANLEIDWDLGANGKYDSEKYQKLITDRVHKTAKVVPGGKGNVKSAFKKANKVVEATYFTPHLVHAPMEVPNATAWVHDGKCEIWAPTQDPQTARVEVAAYLGIEEKDVTINVTFLGGGFGRKSKPDYIVEATAISKKINGPVQVVWTREDDIQHSYYHSTCVQYLKGSIDENGKVTGWLQRLGFPSIVSTFKPLSDFASGFELGQGFINNPFEIENTRFENAKAEPHIRIGWLRSVIHIHSGFGINTFVDELAATAGKDPLQFNLDLIGKDRIREGRSEFPLNTKRLKNVLKKATDMADWGKKLPEGHGMGLAVHYSFYSYVATVVEVSVKEDKVKVHNVYSAVDCGMALNKDNVLNQMQGAAIFGMSLTYFGKITAKDGAIEQSNFHDYEMARMKDAPNIEVAIIESDEPATGVGEPGVPPVAPAICNAIFNATGKRIRSLPLKDHGLV
jgi:isoquinoline 1-oxidoreductase beta subunit